MRQLNASIGDVFEQSTIVGRRRWFRNGLNLRRPKKKWNMLNDKRTKSCLSGFNNGAHNVVRS